MSMTRIMADFFGSGTPCELRVNVTQHETECATITIQTGGARIQTYLNPAQCEELSSMLLLAAAEMRKVVA